MVKFQRGVKMNVSVTTCKNELCGLMKKARKEPIFVKRHGHTCGVLIGFRSDDEALEWQFENDPRFLKAMDSRRKEKTVPFVELHE